MAGKSIADNKVGSMVRLSETANNLYSRKRIQKGKKSHTISNIMETILEECAKNEALVDKLLGIK